MTNQDEGLETVEIEEIEPSGPKLASLLTVFSGKILWAVFLVLVLAIGGHLAFSDEGFVRSSGLEDTKKLLEAENLRLEEENRQLTARLERIRADPGYLEDEARKKLGLVRPDEIIFRLAEEPELSDEEVRVKID